MSDWGASFAARAHATRARFEAALADPAQEQARQLRRMIDDNVDTVFGREHGFGKTMTAAEYRNAVPVRSFDELNPWVRRQLEGEPAVLTMSPPVLYFSTTGTTGAPKHVPLTREFLTRWTNNLLVYWANVIDRFPKVLERDDTILMLHLAPKPFSKFTPQKIPIHVSTEMPVLSAGAFPFSRAPWFPPPSELSDQERIYYLLRASAESPLAGIVCLHSSRLQATVATLEREGERLIREVRDGTMFDKPWRDPNPSRASVLDALRSQGTFSPRHVWPSLQFVSSWIGASFDLYRNEIEQHFTPTIVPQMTVSSEVGHMTMPMGTEVADGPLTVHTNYYEFIPEEGSAADALSFSELEKDHVYEIVVTTCSGLYRYSCGDQFRVSGFVGDVPRLDFVGRKGVSDLAGEKVTEQHVTAALLAACGETGLEIGNSTMVATSGRPARYVAVVEPRAAWPPDAAARFAASLESALRKQAPRYDLKRGFGDLGTLDLRLVPRGTFDRYRAQRVAAGVPGTQLKDKVLHFHYESEILAKLATLSEGGA